MNPIEIETGDNKLGEVVDELLSKMGRGEPVDVEDYAKQHPDAAEVLRHAIPALQALARSNSSGDSGPAATVKTSAGNMANDFASGRTLGDFKLVGELGRGGMGVVYEAEEISLGRKVALKVLPFAGIVDDRALQRFRNEVRAAAALDHPNIVSVHSAGEQRGVHYYAMQLVRGQSLAEVIRQLAEIKDGDVALSGDSISRIVSVPVADSARSDTEPTDALAPPAEPLPPEDTRPIEQHRQQTLVASTNGPDPHYYRSVAILGMQAAGALQHAHDNGVLHRDIKPGNLMLDAQSQLYVTDFGLARIETDAAMTMTGDLIGTLRYMSPEQALAKQVVIDQRSDIYSLGATFYELLTLRPVFGSSDRHALLKQIAFEEPIKLRKIDRAIPSDLETIIHKSLAKNPDERYTTAEEFAADLQAFIDHRPITARPPTSLQRLGKWSRRNRGLVASGAIAAGICLVLLVISNILVARQKALAIKAAASESTQRQNAERERDAAEQARKQAEDVARFLVDAFRSPDPDKDGSTVTVFEVLDQAAEELESKENIGPKRRANMLSALGRTYVGLGLGREAVPLLEEVRTLRQENLGEKHKDTLTAMNNLAIAYSTAGRTKDAFELERRTLKIQREVLGDRHRDTLKTMSSLATSYKDLGQIAEAIELHKKTLKVKREVLGEKDQQTLLSMHDLALAYDNAGRSSEALELMQETYELRREVHGEENRNTLNSMGMLGMVYLSAGEPAKAAGIVERSLKLMREVLGERHSRTLLEESNLAVIYSSLGRYEDALAIDEKVLKLKREKLGERHPSTVTSMINLTLAYGKARRFEEMLELAKDTLTLAREVYGHRHPKTLHAMNAFASALMGLRRYPEVIELAEELAALRREELGEQHPDTLTSMANLALCYGATGRYNKAIESMEQALEVQRNKLGERHPNTLETMKILANYCRLAGQLPKAISLSQTTRKLMREVLGKLHPDVMSLTHNLADCYYRAGQYDEAVEQYKNLLSVYEENEIGGDLGVNVAKNGLALVYSSMGRYEEAAKMHKDCLQFVREQQGERHPNAVAGMLNLASDYGLLGQHEDASELYEEAFKLSREVLGPWDHTTLVSMLFRANVYREAGQYAEASQRFDEAIDFLKDPPDNVDLDRDAIDDLYAQMLSFAAKTKIRLKQFDKAEAFSRQALQLKERLSPDHWNRFSTQTTLGEALLKQAKIDEAEQHLLDGFAGMESRKDSMSVKAQKRLAETCQLLVDLYQIKGDADNAEMWEQLRQTSELSQ